MDEDQDGMDSPGSSPEYVYDEATGALVEVDCDGQPVRDDEPAADRERPAGMCTPGHP